MSTLERAIMLATEAHDGQVDKAGKAYILHPLRVMLSLRSTEEMIVGVLHDVVEDCPGWTFERLRSEGFSVDLIAGLEAVTKRDGEDYDAFVRRAAAHPIGRKVKRADIEDNCDLTRLTKPTKRDFERIFKYKRALAYLEGLGS
jgi:(p)ppGpp synthase/HD superfamily hydrolase